MKPAFVCLTLFSLLLLVILNDARNDPQDYWKSIMKDQALPQGIMNLIVHDQAFLSSDEKVHHLVKDFDTRSNAIIYHSHGHDNKQKEENSSAKSSS